MMELKTIGEILKDRLVVPEIQRDYVWGANKENPEIVENFVNDLNERAKNDAPFQLGFLYSYFHGGELYLIDGQQRMTTIVLLIYFCLCKENENVETGMSLLGNFSYRVRIDTEEFLHTLLANQKLFSQDLNLFQADKLTDVTWHRSKYNNDTTIVSMVKCLDTIYKLRNKLGNDFKISSSWILNQLSFWTFEVNQTSQGEELYISMNSRGEALTESDLFKSRLLEVGKDLHCGTAKSWGKAWDNWEEFLFSKRTFDEIWDYPVESVSDAMRAFLKTVIELETGKPHDKIDPTEDAKSINLQTIESYFSALECICKEPLYHKEIQGLYDSNYSLLCLKILLTLFKINDESDDISRIYPIIKNWERRGLLKNEALLKILTSYSEQREEHIGWINYIISVADSREKRIEGVLDHHEFLKICRYQQLNDPQIESVYHEAEEISVLRGYIQSIWSEAFDDGFNWEPSSLIEFIYRFSVFKALFSENNIKPLLSKKPQRDTVDNSLISRTLFSYPDEQGRTFGVYVGGGNNYTYGYNKDWRRILNNPTSARIVSRMIDDILVSDIPHLANRLNEIIEMRNNIFAKNDIRYYILHYPCSLRAHSQGYNRIGFDGDWDNFGVWVISKSDLRSAYINMFANILFYELENENTRNISRHAWGITLPNGLQLLCSTLQGWDVRYVDWVKDDNTERISELKEKLINLMGNQERVIDNEITRRHKQFYINRLDEDQIELGKKIFHCIELL